MTLYHKILIVMVLFVTPLFAQDFSIEGHPYEDSFRISGSKATYINEMDPEAEDVIDEFETYTVGQFHFIKLKHNPDYNFLFLKSKYFSVLLNKNNIPVVWGINTEYKKPDIKLWGIFEGSLISAPVDITATSFLNEGDVKFLPGNIGSLHGGKPWVEGVKGLGIGEKISFLAGKNEAQIHTLIISIGYVDYNKPYLYESNSRPKKLLITNSNKTLFYETSLEDTPNPQIINLPIDSNDITIEIIEVYPGQKWQDTCINFIYGVSGLYSFFDVQR